MNPSPRPAPARPQQASRLPRLLTVALALLVALVPIVAGLGAPARAAVDRVWYLSGVTFDDGGVMTGSFVVTAAGAVTQIDITTSGGNTGVWGESTTYDDASAQSFPWTTDEHVVAFRDLSRYVRLAAPFSTADGITSIALDPSRSYECNNCGTFRRVTAGSLTPAAPVTLTGTPVVTGTTSVGQTLTADLSALTSDPADATRTYRWLRDGSTIDDATASTYEITNADAGHILSVSVGATAPGRDAAPQLTSAAVGPVGGGTITLPVPTATGTPVVDGTLTAGLSDPVDPADANLTYTWLRGDDLVGTGATYSPQPADVGSALTLTATAGKDHFDTTSSSVLTSAVAAAQFATGPAPVVTGTAKVGEVLTVEPGTTVPAATSYDYRWMADGTPIDGADQATFMLTPAQRHTTVSVEVTAHRDGYDAATEVSSATGDVATNLAPSLELDVAEAALRRGRATTLTWSSDEAVQLAASGAWSGERAAAGSVTVRPTQLGVSTYVLSATNANGTTTAQVAVSVRREARTLQVTAAAGRHLAGRSLPVTARGLDAGERYVIRIGTTTVATGTMAGPAPLRRTVTLPSSLRDGTARVTVIGSESDRRGSAAAHVLAVKRLAVTPAVRRIRASETQRVTVTGLVAHEQVTVTYEGKRVSPRGATADGRGRYTVAFDVDVAWGRKTVRARGAYPARAGSGSFEVVQRCTVGWLCS